MKFSSFTLKNDETKPYASGIIHQALRGLEVVDELEKDGLILRDKEKHVRCTNMGQNVTVLGVPVGDARSVMRALGRKSGKLENIILSVTVARTGLPRDVVRRVLQALPATKMEELVHCQKDLPGIVENCVEELQYVNSILLRIMEGDKRRRLRRESLKLEKNLIALLDSVK
jgi:hypothetical protein